MIKYSSICMGFTLLLGLILLTGCGQKGPLYYPEKQQPASYPGPTPIGILPLQECDGHGCFEHHHPEQHHEHKADEKKEHESSSHGSHH